MAIKRKRLRCETAENPTGLKAQLRKEQKSEEIRIPIGGFSTVIAKRGDRIAGVSKHIVSNTFKG